MAAGENNIITSHNTYTCTQVNEQYLYCMICAQLLIIYGNIAKACNVLSVILMISARGSFTKMHACTNKQIFWLLIYLWYGNTAKQHNNKLLKNNDDNLLKSN